jgi:hypothetical protein
MRTTWQTETGHLACRWFEIEPRVQYNPWWMQESSHVQSGFLPPPPNFASHSPFGGATWFQPHIADRDFE